jgi:hypothetical protein
LEETEAMSSQDRIDELRSALIEAAVLMERVLDDERRDWSSRPVATGLQTIQAGLEQYAALVDNPEMQEELLRLEGVVGRVVLEVQQAVMEDYGRARDEG